MEATIEQQELSVEQKEAEVRQRLGVIDPPQVPFAPQPKLKKAVILIVMALIVGCILSLVAVVIGTILDRTIRFPGDVKERLDTRALAVVPKTRVTSAMRKQLEAVEEQPPGVTLTASDGGGTPRRCRLRCRSRRRRRQCRIGIGCARTDPRAGPALAPRHPPQECELRDMMATKPTRSHARVRAQPRGPRPGTGETLVLRSQSGELLHVAPPRVTSAFRATVARLRLADDLPIRFGVVSAIRGEGVTFISRALALVLANNRDNVCLVDLNWRHPGTWGPQIDGRPGLAEVLRGSASINDTIVPTSDPALTVLPAGDTTIEEPPVFASSPELADVLEELDRRFDQIVIDLPALHASSEALTLAAHADAGRGRRPPGCDGRFPGQRRPRATRWCAGAGCGAQHVPDEGANGDQPSLRDHLTPPGGGMNVWIVFLFASFLLGARATRRDRTERSAWMLVGCVIVATFFLFERFA